MNELEYIKIRNGKSSDHGKIVSVMPEWWGGRDLSSSVIKVFFIHFNQSTFIAEIEDELIGFLVGFMSQSEGKSRLYPFCWCTSPVQKIWYWAPAV